MRAGFIYTPKLTRLPVRGLCTSSSSTITASFEESSDGMTKKIAPFGVFFDATATTSTQTTRPFHDVGYWWDFGDTSAGTWSNGTGANTNRNIASGPVAVHMFETAGTYTITLTTHDGVSTSTTTKTITVTAADDEWTTTKTVCYSTTSDFTDAPSGATQVNVTATHGGDLAAAIANNIGTGNKRHLLHDAQTFSISSSIMIDKGGPSMLGKFGSGANPIINSMLSGSAAISLSRSTTPTGVSDWRFQDFTVDCNNQTNSSAFAGNGSFSKVLMNRVYTTRCNYGLLMSGSTIDALNSGSRTHAMWDQFYLVDSTIYDLYPSSSGPNAIFACGSRAAVIGCNINNNSNGEHGIRFQYCNRAVFNNNTVQGIASGKVNITIRGYLFGGGNTLDAGQYSEKVVISDNHLVGGASVGMVGIGPQNITNDERGRNMLFERNLLLGSTSVTNMMLVSQPDVTIRNNMINIPAGASGGFAFGIQPSGVVPVPDRVNVYNNSIYYGGSTTNYWAAVWVSANNDTSPYDQTMPGSVFNVKNNIVYAPNRVSGYVSITTNNNGSVATTNASNNSSDVTTSPAFATNPPTAISHFTPSSGSYANAAGTNVKNWKDFYGTSTQATPDMGAVVI